MKTVALVILALVVAIAVATGARIALGTEVLAEVSGRDSSRRPETADRGPVPESSPKAKPPVPSILNIPRLHLRVSVGTDIDRGPAWWPRTGRPGEGDTVAVAGHRTTHTRPFYNLDRLKTGDAIWLSRVRYTVTGRRILSSKNLHIADARGYEVLLLSACHPKYSAKQRIVVYARRGE